MKDRKHLHLTNPADNLPFAEFPLMQFDEIRQKSENGKAAFREWQLTSVEKRISAIQEVIDWFRQNKSSVAKDITLQMGKPITQSENEVDGAIFWMEGLSRIAKQALEPGAVKTSGELYQKVHREPVAFGRWSPTG